ncbi:MAG: hypothetical protein HYX61_08100 [Gammaproteobacteria bacterium]|jgi:methionyl-tRNA formyltransferase|nr:hypothetical protein [Gammaproteobacteria bacterium]
MIRYPEVIFLTALDDQSCFSVIRAFNKSYCKVVRTLESLHNSQGDILLSYGSSIIVPPEILSQYPWGAYNIHAASPDYPGRDPHHWAAYDGVLRYGATAHIMTPNVDDGPIVDVEWFDVEPQIRPNNLLRRANEAAFKIILRLAPKLQEWKRLQPLEGVSWGKYKRSRANFLEMCRVSAAITKEEFERKLHAFSGDKYNNLVIELHGHIFRIEKKENG